MIHDILLIFLFFYFHNNKVNKFQTFCFSFPFPSSGRPVSKRSTKSSKSKRKTISKKDDATFVFSSFKNTEIEQRNWKVSVSNEKKLYFSYQRIENAIGSQKNDEAFISKCGMVEQFGCKLMAFLRSDK